MKTFKLGLMASLPGLLAACGGSSDIDLDSYSRKAFKSETECRTYYKDSIKKGLSNPCDRQVRSSGGFIYWGPYYSAGTTGTRYLGYSSPGKVSSSGLEIGKSGTVNTYKAPSVSRGGLNSTARAGSSSSSYGG